MASPAVKAPAKGNHVLFLVRNPNGISSVISYLNNRSVKSWTATSLQDAAVKIKAHDIQLVFVSISLKNVSVFGIIESIKTQFKLPIVIFSEEDSRKIEGDMAKLATPNKIVPPNQNAKFFHLVQKNLGASSKAAGGGDADAENLLPPNVEPIEGGSIPAEGRWLKISADNRKVAPFTYKFIQPRRATIGRIRYFYVGPASPDKNAKGWSGAESGLFYIVGKIVEAAEEPQLKIVKPKVETAAVETSTDEFAVDVEVDEEWPGDYEGEAAQRLPAKPAVPLSDRLRKSWDFLLAKFNGSAKEKAELNAASGMTLGKSFAQSWDQCLDFVRDFSAKILGQTQPKTSRIPQSMIEKELLRAAMTAVSPPLTEKALDEQALVGKMGVAFIKSAEVSGFVFADLNDQSMENWSAFLQMVDTITARFAKRGTPLEMVFEPTVVQVEPFALVAAAKANSVFMVHVESEFQRLVAGFVEVDDMALPQATSDPGRMAIQASALNPEHNLLFNLYLHMPINNKNLHYFREGRRVEEKTISKLTNSTAEIVIERAALAAYFAYSTTLAILKKKK